jgi:hypothetical protein
MTKSQHKYWSKTNPRPKPIGYQVNPNRKQFPAHLFDKDHDPRPHAMEAYRKRNYRYPAGITPIYEDRNGCPNQRPLSRQTTIGKEEK